MIKCLNQKRLNLERSRLFFYLSTTCLTFLGFFGKFSGNFDKILNNFDKILNNLDKIFSDNLPPFPGMMSFIFEILLFYLAFSFFLVALHYYFEQED